MMFVFQWIRVAIYCFLTTIISSVTIVFVFAIFIAPYALVALIAYMLINPTNWWPMW